MKALIRNEGETILETYDLPFIDWKTGAPLTNPKWFGGPYQLVKNYVAPQEDVPESYEPIPTPAEEPEEPEEEVTVTEDTVIIDGKEYTKAELRALLGE